MENMVPDQVVPRLEAARVKILLDYAAEMIERLGLAPSEDHEVAESVEPCAQSW